MSEEKRNGESGQSLILRPESESEKKKRVTQRLNEIAKQMHDFWEESNILSFAIKAARDEETPAKPEWKEKLEKIFGRLNDKLELIFGIKNEKKVGAAKTDYNDPDKLVKAWEYIRDEIGNLAREYKGLIQMLEPDEREEVINQHMDRYHIKAALGHFSL